METPDTNPKKKPEENESNSTDNGENEQVAFGKRKEGSRYETEEKLEEMSGEDNPGTIDDHIANLLQEVGIPQNAVNTRITRELLTAETPKELSQTAYKLTGEEEVRRALVDEIASAIAESKGLEYNN